MSTQHTSAQKRLISNFMACRKRAWASTGRTASDFPVFREGMTTHEYIAMFKFTASHQHVLPYDLKAMNRPAPYCVGPEVTEEISL